MFLTGEAFYQYYCRVTHTLLWNRQWFGASTSSHCPTLEEVVVTKRGTPNHPKMHDLARRLGVPIYSAIGLMEGLWHYAAQYSPRGDIGRFPDVEIARGIGWDSSSPEVLMSALVGSGWLDKDPQHRFLVHDWAEHADDVVRKRLLRQHLDFYASSDWTKSAEIQPPSGQNPPLSGSREAMAMALANGSGNGRTPNVSLIDRGETIDAYWKEIWAMDPYGTNEPGCRAKFMELLLGTHDPVAKAADLVLNRKAWLEFAESRQSKALGLMKWLDGDCFKSPPKPNLAASQRERYSTEV